MRKHSMYVYLLIVLSIVGFNIFNYLSGIYNSSVVLYSIFPALSISLLVSITVISWAWNCDHRDINPISVECRIYPTCLELIIDGKYLFRYGKREEMYEKLISRRHDKMGGYGLKNVFMRQPISVLRTEDDVPWPVLVQDCETLATVHSFIIE